MSARRPMRLNIDALLRVLILWGLAGLFLSVYFGGRARLLVHPRIDNYLLFAALFLAAIPLFSLDRLFALRPAHSNPFRYTAFALLLCFSLFLQVVSLSSGSALTDREIGVWQQDGSSTSAPTGVDNPDLAEDGAIVITDLNHFTVITDMYATPHKYAGREIEFIGFVLKRSSYAPDQIQVGRMVMWCCVADMVVLGLMCSTDEAVDLEAWSWVSIKGVVEVSESNDGAQPLVMVTELIRIEAPENEYVYP